MKGNFGFGEDGCWDDWCMGCFSWLGVSIFSILKISAFYYVNGNLEGSDSCGWVVLGALGFYENGKSIGGSTC